MAAALHLLAQNCAGDSARPLGPDAALFCFGEHGVGVFVGGTALPHHAVCRPRNGTAALHTTAVFRLSGFDDAGDRLIAICPTCVAGSLRVRQHQAAEQFGDGIGPDPAADVARGQRTQLRVITLATDDKTDEFRVLARLLAGAVGIASGAAFRLADSDYIKLIEQVDTGSLDDLDAMVTAAGEAPVVVGLRQRPAL